MKVQFHLKIYSFVVFLIVILTGFSSYPLYSSNLKSNQESISLNSSAIVVPFWRFDSENIFTSAAISSDGDYIAALVGDNATVFMFYKDSSIPLWNYSIGEPYFGYLISISGDGNYIVVGTEQGKIFLFNRSSNLPLWNYSIGMAINDIKTSNNGSYIFVGSQNKEVLLFYNYSSTPKWTYTAHEFINKVDITPDGTFMIAGDGDGYLYFFHKDSNVPLWSYDDPGSIMSLSMSQEGKYIALGTSSSLHFLNSSNSNYVDVWNYYFGYVVDSVKISANGSLIAASSKGTTYIFASFFGNIPAWQYTSVEEHEVILDMSLDGSYLFIYEALARSCRLFNLPNEDLDWIFEFDEYYYPDEDRLSMSDDGKYLLICASHSIYLLDRDGRFFPDEFTVSATSCKCSALDMCTDFNGKYFVNWNSSEYAKNYTLFQYDDHIYDVDFVYDYLYAKNLSVYEELASGLLNFSYKISGSITGNYYYIVQAHNEYGSILSNVLVVNVRLNELIIGYDLSIMTGLVAMISVILVIKKEILNKKKH